MKFNVKALLVMITAFAALPGCGKKTDDVGNAGIVTNTSVSAIGSGQCATISANTGVYLTFYGNLAQNVSGVAGDLSTYGYGSSSFGGSNYTRTLNTGDVTNVYVSGSTAYAVLYISANTATAIVQGQTNGSYYNYSATAQVCGMEINQGIIAGGTSGAGYTGTLGGGYTKLWGPNSWITYGAQYGNQPILF